MVDKIDRPKPPEPWTIKATASTQDQGQQQEQPMPDQEDEFSSPGSPESWEKFHERKEARRIVQVNREEIRHVWFRKAQLQRHLAMVECDMELTSGTLLRQALILLQRMDDYFHFKGYAVGQEIPVTSLVHEPVVEVSVPRPRAQVVTQPPRTSTPPQQPRPVKWWQLWDPNTGNLRPLFLAALGVSIALTIVVIMALLLG